MFARRPDLLEREAASGSAGSPSRGDVTSAADFERLVRTAVDAFGGIDILVNNSGGPPRTPAVGLTEEQVDAAVRLLLVSVVRLTGLCLPYLERSDCGRIVNITSSTVREPTDNLALSNAVRPGVIGWAKSLARELGPQGITVNSIAPGRIDTERIREVYPDGPTEADLADDSAPRLGTPREIGDVVAFLCSERAAYITRHRHPRRRRTHPRPPSERLKRLSVTAVVLGALGLVAAFILCGSPGRRVHLRRPARPSRSPAASWSRAPARSAPDDVYYVDVFVRRTSRLEDLFPFTRPEGSTVLSRASSAAARDHARRSATARTRPTWSGRSTSPPWSRSARSATTSRRRRRGALVIGVASDVPAAAKLEPGDVIVGVDGARVRTPDRAPARDRRGASRARTSAHCAAGRRARSS